jgi:PHP family Zn ribbon phosphoesterase
VIFSPQETIQHKYLCPRCGKKLTVGVMHRVENLADREMGDLPPTRIPYKNLIPFNEIVAHALSKTSECKSVWEMYFKFIHEFGDEHRILTEVPIQELARLSPERVSVAVDRMRKGHVKIVPGHDGEFGKICLFDDDTVEEEAQGQLKLF